MTALHVTSTILAATWLPLVAAYSVITDAHKKRPRHKRVNAAETAQSNPTHGAES